jgi:hypothetical protein
MNKEELHRIIEKQQPNICQIVAVKNNKTVYNDNWNNYKTTDNVHIASVTKSIISILIGIAIDKGMIESVNQKVLDFFPDYVIKRGEKTIQDVTLYNLLTMTAPYKCKSEPWTKVCTSEDWTNEDIVITIDLEEDVNPNGEYEIEYSKDGGDTWEKYNPDEGIKVTENGEIEVRLTDGTNIGEGITITIENIDKLAKALNVAMSELFNFQHKQNRTIIEKDLINFIKIAETSELEQIYKIIHCIMV